MQIQIYQNVLAACNQHTVARTHGDITVQTCFDADRFDLARARIGKVPDPAFCVPTWQGIRR